MFVFVCYAVREDDVLHNRAVSVPGNKQALLFTELFREKYGKDFKCITIPPRQASLRDFKKKSLLQGKQLIPGVNAREIIYINLPIIKIFSIRVQLYKALKQLCKENKNKDMVVMSVNSNACVSKPIIRLKKKYGFKTGIYLSDMPFEENYNKSFLKKIITKYDNYVRLKALDEYDGSISGVDYLNEKYFKNKKYTRIDPALEIECYKQPFTKKDHNGCINVVYTGSLNDNYNIPNIIEAFCGLPEKYNIYFYGRGQYVALIEEKSKDHSNIHYMGYLEFKDIVKVQQDADILITLLDTDKNISKYAVPSKIFDYLCTGVPIISSNVLSVIDEVKSFVTLVDDHSVEDIKNTIIRITENEEEKSNAFKKALAGQQYVFENCNWDVQIKRINDFLVEAYE